jgi:hypothetical protein
METVKEKLAKLIDESKSYANHQCFHTQNVCVECPFSKESNCKKFYQAEYLIQNGVTIATDTNVGDKWVSVDERLPISEEEARRYYEINLEYPQFIVKIQEGVTATVLEFDGVHWVDGHEFYHVTHWMTMPQPPKGVK